MGGELISPQNVDGLQLVLISISVNGVVAFARLQNGEVQNEADLKYFTSIVLKDVGDAMFHRELLILAYRGEQLLKQIRVWMGFHVFPSFSNSLTVTPSASASRPILSIDTFRSPRSIDPKYVRCRPASSARDSCEIAWLTRSW